jgi:chemotaxis protein CheX
VKTEYISPFIDAAFSVIKHVLGEEPGRGGDVSARQSTFTTQQCSVIVGVTGGVTGVAVYGMSLATAEQVASRMLDRPVKTFNQLASSAVAELTNMITGNAMSLLAETGYICDISPPTVIRGSNVRLGTLDLTMLVIPIRTSVGTIEINVSLRENPRACVRAA